MKKLLQTLCEAIKIGGWKKEEVVVLINNLPKIHLVIRDIMGVVDSDAKPVVPDSWRLIKHRDNGALKWDEKKVSLYSSEGDEEYVFLKELCKILENKNVLNASFLYFLLENKHLIPKEWKEKMVVFWGTKCRPKDRKDGLVFLALHYKEGEWEKGSIHFDNSDILRGGQVVPYFK